MNALEKDAISSVVVDEEDIYMQFLDNKSCVVIHCIVCAAWCMRVV